VHLRILLCHPDPVWVPVLSLKLLAHPPHSSWKWSVQSSYHAGGIGACNCQSSSSPQIWPQHSGWGRIQYMHRHQRGWLQLDSLCSRQRPLFPARRGPPRPVRQCAWKSSFTTLMLSLCQALHIIPHQLLKRVRSS
jgi:hypothetical protein